MEDYKHKGRRARLVKELILKGITDESVLEAIGRVPRHVFVEGVFSDEAYEDKALPIHREQTISQPFTVAFQTQLLELKPRMKILEIGTGSGYQAAVLCEMGMRVFSVEIDRRLHLEAKERLKALGYEAQLLLGDGSEGWPTYQPYERILVTAASPGIPDSLKSQLEVGGIMVLPVGTLRAQKMTVVVRVSQTDFEVYTHHNFKFVPLRGRFGFE
ncbi:MAG: protein-L-isoaspartate(D-aspartate) O-methyltransferase [Bacteroidia bacterium]|nr:protein-L-isoaspartate(D-aspartate) O-methyltransferase [Bacteroidia bacterium]